MSCMYLAHHELERALKIIIIINITSVIATTTIIIIIIVIIIIYYHYCCCYNFVFITTIIIIVVTADTPTKGRRQVVDSRALAARPGRSEEQSLRAKQERRAQLRHQMQARTNSNTLEVSPCTTSLSRRFAAIHPDLQRPCAGLLLLGLHSTLHVLLHCTTVYAGHACLRLMLRVQKHAYFYRTVHATVEIQTQKCLETVKHISALWRCSGSQRH